MTKNKTTDTKMKWKQHLSRVVLLFFALLSSPAIASAVITYQSSGTDVYSATNLNPGAPASVAEGDLLLAIVGMKPSSANSGSTTPLASQGWSLVGGLTGAGGYGATLGIDTGNTNIYAFYRRATSTDGQGNFTVGTGNVAFARMFRLSSTNKTWHLAVSTGSTSTAPLATGGVIKSVIDTSSDPGVTTGDFVLAARVIPTDVTTPSQFSAHAFTQSGITFGTVVEGGEWDSTTGNDIGGYYASSTVSSGTSSGAPTFSATVGGTGTNVRGPGIFVRVREIASSTVTTQAASSVTNATATLNGNITATGGTDSVTRGFAWGTSATMVGDTATTTESGVFSTGAFTGSLSSLTCNTTYYSRAYSTNGAGVGIGTSIQSFATSACPPPTVTTQDASSITATGATLNGNITATGGLTPTVRGFAWGTSATMVGDTATTTENGSFTTGAFTNSSLTLVCNTTYYYRPYAVNTSGTSSAPISNSFTTSACPTTTLGDGTDPGNSTVGPGASTASTTLDKFTFTTSSGSDTITAVTVTLSPASSFNNLATVGIVGDTNLDNKCTQISDPSSLTLNFTGCSISADTDGEIYRVMITPETHSGMPAVPGASYDITGTVTGWTGTNTQAGTDTDSATITVDNASPSNATSASGTAGQEKVTLAWTTSASADFSRTVILRWAAGSVGAEVPVEGTDYTAGDTITTATVACMFSADAASTAKSDIVDGTGGTAGCTTSALTGGQAYSYRVFQKDSRGNYDAGVTFTGSPFTPTAPTITISGTCDAFDQTTDCTDIGEVKVAVNGVVQAQTQATIAGTWSIASVEQPSAGASVVVFIDTPTASTDKATAVTLYDGSGDIDLIRLYKEHLTIGTDTGSANSAQSLVDTNLDDYDTTNDADVLYDILASGTCETIGSFTGLCVDGSDTSSQERLLVLSGNTYTAGGTVQTDNLTVTGTFVPGANTVRIQGSGTPVVVSGTFTLTSSTVDYTSASSPTILNTTYQNLTISGTISSGTQSATVAGAFVVSGTFTPSAGAIQVSTASGSITNSGTLTFNNLTIAGSATVTTSSSFSIAGTLTNSSSASFTASAGTITANGGATITNSGTLLSFYNLTIGSGTVTANTSYTVSNVLTVTGTLAPTSGTVTLSGSGTPLVINGTFTPSSTNTVTYSNAGATVADATYKNLTISGAITAGTTVTVGGVLTLSNTSFAPAGGTITMNNGSSIVGSGILGGSQPRLFNLTIADGATVSGTSGYFRFHTAGTFTVGSGATFTPYSLGTIGDSVGTLTGSGTVVVNLATGSPKDFNNQYKFGTRTLTNLTVHYNGSQISAINAYTYGSAGSGGLKISDVAEGSITTAGVIVGGVLTTTYGFDPAGGSTITMNDGSSIVTTGSAPTFNNLAIAAGATVTTASDFGIDGTLTTGSGSTFNATAGTFYPLAASSLSNSGGTISLYNVQASAGISINTDFTIKGRFTTGGGPTITQTSGTLTLGNGAELNFTSGTITFYNLTIEDGATADVIFDNNFDISNVLTVGTGSTFAPSTGTVTMNNGSSISNSGTLTFQDLVIEAASTVTGNTSYSIVGTLTNSSTGVFTSNAGTVTCAGCTIDNGGTTLTFNNLTTTGTVTAGSSNGFTVSGTLNVSSGTFTGSVTPLRLNGDLTIASGATWTKGAGIVTFGKGSAQTWTDSTASKQDIGTVQVSVNGINNTSLSLGSSAKASTVTIDDNQTFSMGGTNTLTLTAPSVTPLVIGTGSTFTASSGSTVDFTGDGASTVIPATTYHHLGLKSGGSTAQIFGSGTFTINGGLTVGDGTNAGATLATNNSIVNAASSTIAANATLTTGTGAVSVTGDLLVLGTLSGTADGTITVNGNATGPGTINLTTAGTFKQRVATSKNFGPTGANSWNFVNLIFSRSASTPTITTLTTGSGNVTVSNVLTVGEAGDGAVTTLDPGDITWTLPANGTPLVLNASSILCPNSTCSGNTSTVNYTYTTGGGAVTVAGTNYYNLNIGTTADANAATTFTLGGSTAVKGLLTVGVAGSTNADTLTTNNQALTVGDLDITSKGSFTAPSSADFIVNDDFTNSGTFTHSSGTIKFNDSAQTSIISGATTFNNFTSNTAGKTIEFQTSGTPLFTFAGTFYLDGGFNSPVILRSDSAGTQWTAKFNSAQSTVSRTSIKDSGCHESSQAVNLDNTATNSGNNASCWVFYSVVRAGGGGSTNYGVIEGEGSGAGPQQSGGSSGSGGSGGVQEGEGSGSGGQQGGGSGGSAGGDDLGYSPVRNYLAMLPASLLFNLFSIREIFSLLVSR